jgi:hypothetical protein
MLTINACGELDDLDNDDVTTATSALTTGEMHRGDYLFANQELWSANCAFKVRMQSDGNLVATEYPRGNVMWASNTAGHTWAYAHLQASDGNFFINHKNGGVPFWDPSGTGGVRLVMQNDGNLVLRNSSGSSVWSIHTQRTPEMGCFGGGQNITRTSRATQISPNTDLPGHDIAPSPIVGVTRTACGSECSIRGGACTHWTWEPGTTGGGLPRCWIKNGTPSAPVNRVGLSSGKVVTRCSGCI